MFPTSCKGSNPICYSRFLWHVLLFYFSFLHSLHQLTFHFRCCHFLSWICSSCMKHCFKKLLDMYRNPFYWLSSFLMLLQRPARNKNFQTNKKIITGGKFTKFILKIVFN